jgi:predicted nucleotidyltransferase
VNVDEARALALPLLEKPSPGAILFGSHARGDNGPGSDIDILQLSPAPRGAYRAGLISVSRYTVRRLGTLAQEGSLFAWHLALEAIALDEGGDRALEVVRSSFRLPQTFTPLRRELGEASRLLDLAPATYDALGARAEELLRFLARTLAYTLAAEAVHPMTFALRPVLAALGDARLEALLAGRPPPHPSWPGFLERRALLSELLSCVGTNPFGSPEALVVNSAGSSPLTFSLGCRLLRASDDVDYVADDSNVW